MVFFGVFSLPSPLPSMHYQKQVTAIKPTTTTALGSSTFVHQTAKPKASIDRSDNPKDNPTKINSTQCSTCPHTLPKDLISQKRALTLTTHFYQASEPSSLAPTCHSLQTCHVSPRDVITRYHCDVSLSDASIC